MIVGIHQPNYLPWLGYFAKMARSDVFVFLDDVQYSKNSIINRVAVRVGSEKKWLTLPVTYKFGDAIRDVRPANAGWIDDHLNRLTAYYRDTPFFDPVLGDFRGFYPLCSGSLSDINRSLIESIATRLGIKARRVLSSTIDVSNVASDDRLIAIVDHLAPRGTYLSGKGGAKYQDPEKFKAAGLELVYSKFEHPVYEQIGDGFIPGLSIVDALFNQGWEATAKMIAP